jgi:hypothetical protein
MKLVYRGIAFQSTPAGADAIETGETATFRGQQYSLKQAQVAQRQGTTELTYRGARYTR